MGPCPPSPIGDPCCRREGRIHPQSIVGRGQPSMVGGTAP